MSGVKRKAFSEVWRKYDSCCVGRWCFWLLRQGTTSQFWNL